MKKRVIIPVLAAIVVGAGVFGVTQTFAQSENYPHQNLIQKLSQKLGISEDKVKTAFDEIHSEKHTQMKTSLENKLNQAVSDGKISQSQKQAILAKFEELKGNRSENFEELKNMTPEQRHQEMDQRKTDFESWASQNGLNPQMLKDLGIFPFGGMKRHMMRGF